MRMRTNRSMPQMIDAMAGDVQKAAIAILRRES
jgi:hypothetical protein